ncbi:pyc, partial [Symbiodinium sp. KB8]
CSLQIVARSPSGLLGSACQEEGLTTVGIYAEEDKGSLHVQRVQEAIRVTSKNPGPIAPYLDVQSVVEAAKQTGAQAVHPGYGFLSESAEFAAACEAAGIVFIGPRPETIALLGDKAGPQQAAANCRSVLKGSPFLDSSQHARDFLASEGLPLPIIFKAAFGGGGRGMRLVRQDGELNEAFERCTSEAKTAFGNGSVFLEEFLDDARHIEVQVLADGQGGCAHLYERDCSVQLRNQKAPGGGGGR